MNPNLGDRAIKVLPVFVGNLPLVSRIAAIEVNSHVSRQELGQHEGDAYRVVVIDFVPKDSGHGDTRSFADEHHSADLVL